MAKLITHHDPFHVHKILGVFVLLHFLYRFIYASWIRGFVFCSVKEANDALCSPEQVHYDAICIVLHGLLSWSSLLLPLPKKRNFNSPMIWIEFRLHSITFATRGVVACLISLYGLWPQQIVLNYLSKLTLILTTCYTADWITAKHGCTEKRTTNAMPYPACVTPEMQKEVKHDYARKQFAGALACITEDAALAWAPLLAIQGAPFLMTLVRKGKIESLTLHRTYILQLCAPLYLLTIGNILNWNKYNTSVVHNNAIQITLIAAIHYLVTDHLRITLRCSKSVTWSVSTACMVALAKTPVLLDAVAWFHFNPVGIAILVSRHIYLGHDLQRHYVPVFTLQPKAPESLDDFDDYALTLFEYVSERIGYQEPAGTTKKAA